MKTLFNKIKEYKSFIIIFILFLLFYFIKLPYYIQMPGGIIDTSSKIDSIIKINTSGSLNMAYVAELRATLPIYIYSLLNDKYDAIKISDNVSENETIEELEYRNKMFLKEANDIATIIAYQKSGKKLKIKNRNLYVTYIDPSSKTDLKIKDKIIKINNVKINNKDDILNIINEHNINDTIEIETNNGIKKATIYESDNKKVIGILVTTDYKFNETINFKFDNKESGPSGGMMMTLAVYNYLNNDILTKNRKIVGTGTIDINGNIGKIDGIKYKLIGAVKNNADIFIVAYENYEEAIDIKNKYKYDINIYPVKTIDDAIKYLKKE